ncbi:MAG: ECA polysaccharide chain length modulation protein [Enterobacteriaceae bacterium]
MKHNSGQTGRPIDSELAIENELDLRGLCQVIWQGKIMIIAVALLFALGALLYSSLVQQQWRSVAIMDKPTINMLGRYYQQQYLLNSLDKSASAQMAAPLADSIVSRVYSEFTLQLGAYDMQRAFWLQSPYYHQRQKKDPRADSVLLEELIGQIQFTPGDEKKPSWDTLSLTAETAADASQLLRSYVAFVDQKVVQQLNEALSDNWRMWSDTLHKQLEQQKVLAQQTKENAINSLKQAIEMAQQQHITQNQLAGVPLDSVTEPQLFLLGKPLLQARLSALTSSGPQFDVAYQQNRQLLAQLQSGPELQNNFQIYRYLQTPEEPITRDSPRRLFLLLLWGSVGIVAGAGVVLGRRVARQPR